jgi:hypothetical protein
MLEAKQGRRANALYNDEFICIETFSGRGLIRRDSKGAQHLLFPNVRDEILGEALLDALVKSRFLSLDEAKAFLDGDLRRQQYTAWLQALTGLYGYKTKKALFKNMKSCSIEMVNGVITIVPNRQVKVDAWEGMRNESVSIAADSSFAEVGATLRLAFSRCT